MDSSREIERVITLLRWYQTIEPHLDRITKLVQANQEYFGDPAAGANFIELAANRLEDDIARYNKRRWVYG